jgi:hypothetical protein
VRFRTACARPARSSRDAGEDVTVPPDLIGGIPGLLARLRALLPRRVAPVTRHIAHFNWATLVADLGRSPCGALRERRAQGQRHRRTQPRFRLAQRGGGGKGAAIGWPLFTRNPRMIASFSVWETPEHFRRLRLQDGARRVLPARARMVRARQTARPRALVGRGRAHPRHRRGPRPAWRLSRATGRARRPSISAGWTRRPPDAFCGGSAAAAEPDAPRRCRIDPEICTFICNDRLGRPLENGPHRSGKRHMRQASMVRFYWYGLTVIYLACCIAA